METQTLTPIAGPQETRGSYQDAVQTRNRVATVLVVEDDFDQLLAYTAAFRAKGWAVVSAEDGLQAVHEAVRERPDAIVLDIGLPCGDGHSVIQRLARNVRTVAIPIVVVTGRDPLAEQSRAILGGAAAYVQKPVDPDVLVSIVSKVMSV